MTAINSFTARFDGSGFNTSGILMESATIGRYKVFWGDGTQEVVDGTPDDGGNIIARIAHTYASGDYEIRVKDVPDDPATPVAKLLVYMHSDATTDYVITTGGLRDMVLAGAGNDVINTGAGNDWISGGSDGDDTINGGLGDDVILGDTGNDRLIGGDGNDLIGGGQGNDIVNGGAGNDSLFGDEGNDTIRGGDDGDFIGGGDGDDRLYGDAGNDLIEGNAGNDKLFGGDGNDRLDGGSGQNQLTGGTGADAFYFAAPVIATLVAAPDKTTIMDFSGTGGDNDQIDIGEFAAVAGVSELSFVGDGAFTGANGEVRYSHNAGGNTLVQIDTNGDKHSDFQIALVGLHDLQAGDFVLGHGMMI